MGALRAVLKKAEPIDIKVRPSKITILIIDEHVCARHLI
jgi:hypothetical protein